MRHGQHRRQSPSKELSIGSVLVELQLTTNQTSFQNETSDLILGFYYAILISKKSLIFYNLILNNII
jgi:hypothetical protein